METATTTPSTLIRVSAFRFGGSVQTSEGEPGTLTQVVMEVGGHTITHIGVRFGLFGRGRVSYAPFADIATATDEQVTLTVTRNELEDGARATPTGFKLSAETQVLLDGKRSGRISQLAFDAGTRRIWRLVIDRGLGGEWTAPARYITQLDAKQITLTGAKLTTFVSNQHLADDIHRAMENYNKLRIDLGGVQVQVADGVVWLEGHVSNDLNRRIVSDQLQGVHGIAEVHNNLHSDTEVANNVSQALANDPRAAHAHVGVYPSLGEVHLRGVAPDAETRTAVAAIARGVAGVGAVVNELHVDPRADTLPVMAGVTGDEDIVPGGS
ncbi:MAG TPA: BON domain-containing protein [Ktedonobacterales bacterium]|nr:BON domain-containing protein [Ktedonobacterales bacterium]